VFSLKRTYVNRVEVRGVVASLGALGVVFLTFLLRRAQTSHFHWMVSNIITQGMKISKIPSEIRQQGLPRPETGSLGASPILKKNSQNSLLSQRRVKGLFLPNAIGIHWAFSQSHPQES
jgi:hypothetical protein